MALAKNEEKRISAKIFSCLSLIAAVVLLVMGIAAVMGGTNTMSMVNKGLVDAKIYFPPANPEVFPDIVKYAGKQVDDGAKAKIFADDFLDVQLKLIGNGKKSSEISAQLAADPQNAALQRLQGTMFQLETNKATLIFDAYGNWFLGKTAKTLGLIFLAASAGMLIVASAQYMRYKKL